MNTTTARRTTDPARARAALHPAKLLVGFYAAISVLTLGAVGLLRHDAALVTDAVWVRVTIVAVTAFLMLAFATSAGRGNARALLRLRLVSAIMVVVIAVIVALPGDGFPTWIKVEQAICGVVLLGVAAIANGPRVRRVFAGR